MAVQGLVLLSGAIPGIRDLVWEPVTLPGLLGYMPFKAENRYGPWTALASAPIPGERFRDQTTLAPVDYTVTADDWTDQGVFEYWAFRVPDAPLYGEVIDGRAITASTPEHVRLTVDGAPVMAARVDGVDGTIWLPRTNQIQGLSDTATPYGQLTDNSVVKVTYNRLANFVDPTPETRCYYTVVPVLSDGSLMHEPGVQGDVANILEVDKLDYMQREIVRRNGWEFEFAGEPAHLLMLRTKGVICGCTMASGQPRTGCTSCYETGIVGGYYGPYDIFFIDSDTGTTVEVSEGGRKVTRQSRSFLGPVPYIKSGDLIVRKNGERIVIENPVYVSARGVLLQQDFDLRLLPSGDTRYRIPLRNPDAVTTYNPAFQDKPGPAGEPVTGVPSDPTKQWENTAEVPQGATVTFQNIQT